VHGAVIKNKEGVIFTVNDVSEQNDDPTIRDETTRIAVGLLRWFENNKSMSFHEYILILDQKNIPVRFYSNLRKASRRLRDITPPEYSDSDMSSFKPTAVPSRYVQQVNLFQTIDEVYQAYNRVTTPHAHQYRLVIPTDALNVTKNEVEAILEYQEIINPLLRQLIEGQGYKPKEEQFVNFTDILESEPEGEESKKLRALADQVANWKGFQWAATVHQLGLEFFTEWTHSAARAIDNVHAFGYADYLVSNNLEDHAGSWYRYLNEDVRAQKLQPFRHTIEEVITPQLTERAPPGTEGMSISAALQDFRRKTPLSINQLLVETGDRELEELLVSRLKAVQEKMDFIKTVMGRYPSIEEAYRIMKTTHPVSDDLQTANNYRRDCGGIGFLMALQQAIKGLGISREFYLLHEAQIKEIATICNEMDKSNFEILLEYGKYEGNAIPSPYAFFAQ
jgi:hypothetical protein